MSVLASNSTTMITLAASTRCNRNSGARCLLSDRRHADRDNKLRRYALHLLLSLGLVSLPGLRTLQITGQIVLQNALNINNLSIEHGSVQHKCTSLRLPHLVEFDKYIPLFAPNINNSNVGGIIVTFGLSLFQIPLQLALDVFDWKLLVNALNANPWARLGKELLEINLNRFATIKRTVVDGLVLIDCFLGLNTTFLGDLGCISTSYFIVRIIEVRLIHIDQIIPRPVPPANLHLV